MNGFTLLEKLRPLLATRETTVYIVGGAVRDALLGREAYDLDFVVAGQAITLAFAVGDALHAAAYVLDRERDIGRVVTGAGVVLDFARFRGEDLVADLQARDFTINAMAVEVSRTKPSGYWPAKDTIIDPCGGMRDLGAQRLRMTHENAIADDPLRALRAVRLAWHLGLEMDEATAEAARLAAPRLIEMSAERVRDELLKILRGPAPHQALLQLDILGLLQITLPEVAALRDVEQTAPHHEPALAHTASVLKYLLQVEQIVAGHADGGDTPGIKRLMDVLGPFRAALAAHLSRAVDGMLDGYVLLRVGAIFHDVGKAQVAVEEADGRIRFLGHEKVGARLAAKRLRALRLSNEAVARVKSIVGGHMRPLSLAQVLRNDGRISRRSVYRYFRDTGESGLDIALLSVADHLSTHNGTGAPPAWQALLSVVEQLLNHYFDRYEETIAPPPLLDGGELIAALHMEPGPQVGRLLRLIEEAQAAGEIHTEDEALDLAKKAMSEW